MKSKKRGQLQTLSIGMIFSIIVIIAILGVSFYAITKFLEIRECTEVSLFYEDFQKKVDQIWASSSAKTVFTGSLPPEVEFVCFSGSGSSVSPVYSNQYRELRRYIRNDQNTFIYPPEHACNIIGINVEHLDLSKINGFTCFPVRDGKVNLYLEKEISSTLVSLVDNLDNAESQGEVNAD